jgi:hypothetical protein
VCMVYWMILHIFIFTLCISWITLTNDILVELLKYYTSQFSPHMTFANLLTKSCLVWFCHTPRRICSFQLAMNKKSSKVPTNLFFALITSRSLAKPFKNEVTYYKHLVSPQTHTLMYTTSSLLGGKCNMILSFDKSLWKISLCIPNLPTSLVHSKFIWIYYFMSSYFFRIDVVCLKHEIHYENSYFFKLTKLTRWDYFTRGHVFFIRSQGLEWQWVSFH